MAHAKPAKPGDKYKPMMRVEDYMSDLKKKKKKNKKVVKRVRKKLRRK